MPATQQDGGANAQGQLRPEAARRPGDSLVDVARNGLYRPETEHDACGVGFLADVQGRASHELVRDALVVLDRMTHRGGVGSDPLTGDGAGILLQIPHDLLARDLDLPAAGTYGVGQLFLPRDDRERARRVAMVEHALARSGLTLLGWRDVPTDPTQVGPVGHQRMPHVAQVFAVPSADVGPDELDRRLYVARKRMEQAFRAAPCDEPAYVCSLSRRTIVYKGLLLPSRVDRFYTDLADPVCASAIAVVHQRFSTNTLPTWERCHPYRMMAHNGEINTLRGNVNRMRAREPRFAPEGWGSDLDALTPVLDPQGSDSAMLDNAAELLVRTGRTLPHAMTMLVPTAWEGHDELSPALRDFYAWHAGAMEPWDGPACVAFTDGRVVGGTLDRNGLRPARYLVTTDGRVVLSSESGVLDVPAEQVARRGRLRPGEMLVVDTVAGEIAEGRTTQERLACRRPYGEWLAREIVRAHDLPDAPAPAAPADTDVARRAFGYTREDIEMLLEPMSRTGKEPIGAMGDDTPLAVLSERPQPLFNYFKQLFAQVTNPPIDPIRERLVMSLRTTLGPEGNLFAEGPGPRRIELDGPVLSDADAARIRALDTPDLSAAVVSTLFDVTRGMDAGLKALCEAAEAAVRGGANVLVLSDRGVAPERAALPALLATAAVHHHLLDQGLRVGLVVESGEIREVMHVCLLVGYGAGAVVPYLAYETVRERGGDVDGYRAALEYGMRKVLSKMGISTLDSYRGAQIFEAVGLSRALVDRYFPGTPSRLDGIGLDVVEKETLRRHEAGWRTDALPHGGRYKWRRDGEEHAYNPQTLGLLQHACRSGDYRVFKRYTDKVHTQAAGAYALRALMDFRERDPVPLSEVEPVSEIVKRFRTGAMSFGSLSKEAHETLAVAMNRLGARSNSGEGGEDPARFTPDDNGDSRRSAIKQVASGRFGVTTEYLNQADELQIKMAQGAKPGEGGQLPGHKVDAHIARTRHSTPGVGLISPPPHHDIYSIEDLAQLIHDLKNANDRARISVKLVSEVGVGTIAAGVAKGKADHILVSGHSGGTGASPLSSVKHAGVPWELGLAETQQVLVANGLRGRVTLETDGQIKTGRDIVVAALLGAEYFGFGTSALVAAGCVLMRVCHKNTCPVGVATQDPELRARFAGQPEHVMNLMVFLATEVREIMAELGFRTMDELVGRVDVLRPAALDHHWKARHLDLSAILHVPSADGPRRNVAAQDHGLDRALDEQLIAAAAPALTRGERVEIRAEVRNVNRTVTTRLSSEIVRRHGPEGLPDGTVRLELAGTAGQSFGAFLAPGLDVRLVGEANDAVCKGMSGGRVAIRPTLDDAPESDVIVGNVALYGATAGELFVRGVAGERFAVRNSGATAVVEGVGDHGCEYMTGGTVVVLGSVGRNFAAGMSGGVAYVLDDGHFAARCNRELVDLDPMTEDDLRRVRDLVRRHHEATDSTVAWRVLSRWRELRGQLVKVMPRDYKRVLAERDADEARSAS